MEPKIIQININDILPNRFQPRIAFNEDKLNELSESIKKYGVIQPITVRQVGNKYEIIAGERRYKASQLAGLSSIPAIVQNFSDEISSEVALIENVQREDLTAIEEAISYKKILDMGTITQEKLADKLGISQPAIANKLRLLQLSEKVQDALMENKISERHARSLLKLKNKVKQEEMLHRIINERLTVRKTDEEIKKILENNDEEKVKSFIPTPEEVEILDIINSFKIEDKKEENAMNPNDPMNSFNIPSVTIENSSSNINDISPVSNQNNNMESIGSFNNSNEKVANKEFENNVIEPNTNITHNNVINPGFMDIDKIEREATDISFNNQKNNIDLMQSTGNISENNSNNMMPKGRFFDVMPSMQNRMEENDNASESNGGRIIGGSIFNDDSKILGTPIINNVQANNESINNVDFSSNVFNNPVIEPVKVKDVYPQNIENIPNTSNIQENQYVGINENNNSNVKNDTSVGSVIEPITEPTPNIIPSAPIIEENNIGIKEETNMVPNIESNKVNTESVIEPIAEPIPSTIPSAPIVEENNFGISEETNMIPNIESNKVNTESVIEPIAEPIPSTIPSAPIIEENNIGIKEETNMVPDIESNINSETINEPIVESTPSITIPPVSNIIENNFDTKEEPVLETINTVPLPKEKEPEINISAPLSFNMREAIQMIRNITDRLERMGHRLDSDEMDLNDRYEIKITLYK